MEGAAEELIGRVYVKVLEGRSLSANQKSGRADAYVRVTYRRAVILTTKVSAKTLDPKWGEDVTVTIEDPLEPLLFEVYSAPDGLPAPPQIVTPTGPFHGQVSLRLSEFADQVAKEAWWPLRRVLPSQPPVSGDLHITVQIKFSSKYQAIFLGDFALQKQNYAPAVRLFSQAIEQFRDTPFITDLYNMRSTALLNLQRLKEALQDTAAVLKSHKDNAQAWYNMGLIYFAGENYDQAKQAFERGASLGDGKCAQGLKDLERNIMAQDIRKCTAEARSLVKAKKFAQAVEILSRVAIELNPRNHVYYWFRALAHIGAGEIEKAEADILTTLRMDPAWPKTQPIRQGELKKQGDVNIFFKSRWFYLKSAFLFYYKTRDDPVPQGLIVVYKAPFELKKNELYIKGRRVYRVKAASVAQMQDWATDIGRVARAEIDLPLDPEEQRIILAQDQPDRQDPVKRGRRRTILEGVTKKVAVMGTQVAAANVALQGWLHKQGDINKAFQRRYFILKWQSLYYFPDQPQANNEGVYEGVKGLVDLSQAKIQTANEPENAFIILPKEGNRTYLLYADSASERTNWMKSIEAAIAEGAKTEEAGGSDLDKFAGATPPESPVGSLSDARDLKMLAMAEKVASGAKAERDNRESGVMRAGPAVSFGGDDEALDVAAMKERRRSANTRPLNYRGDSNIGDADVSASEKRFYKFALPAESSDSDDGGDGPYNPYQAPDYASSTKHGSMRDFSAERERLLDGEAPPRRRSREEADESKPCCACTIL